MRGRAGRDGERVRSASDAKACGEIRVVGFDPVAAQSVQRSFTVHGPFYSDEDNHARALLSALLGMVGQFFFLSFLGGLWSTLRTASGKASTPTMVLAMGGAASFALGVLEHLVGNVVGITLNFSEGGYRLDPGLALILSNLASGAFLGAMTAVAAAAWPPGPH